MIGDHSQKLSELHQHKVIQNNQPEYESIFSLDFIQRKISSLTQTKPINKVTPAKLLQRDTSIDPGKTDAPGLHTFQSSDRHTDVSPQQLSERWGISLTTAYKTLKTHNAKFPAFCHPSTIKKISRGQSVHQKNPFG